MKKIFCTLLITLSLLVGATAMVEPTLHAITPQVDGVKLPVIMYHSVLNKRTSRYIVSEKQLESDLKALKSAGYTSVFPSEVVMYIEGKAKLPPKPIMITFDDGYYNNLFYALPLLKKYNCKANINIVGSYSNYSVVSNDHSNPNYSHLTWEQIKELVASGLIEIGNHTYAMHALNPRFGIGKLRSEDGATYKTKLTADIGKLNDILIKNCNIKPTVFAFPFGRMSKTSKQIISEMGFTMMLTCIEKVNVIKVGDYPKLQNIFRFNREGSYSSEALLAKIEPKN